MTPGRTVPRGAEDTPADACWSARGRAGILCADQRWYPAAAIWPDL